MPIDVWLIVSALIAVLIGAAMWLRSRKIDGKAVDLQEIESHSKAAPASDLEDPAPEVLPEKIHIGGDPASPLVVVEKASDFEAYVGAKELDVSSSTVGRFAVQLQAASSMLLAADSHGKQLMEVRIMGDMVRASDGNGLRAFSMGKDGIQEHGRLFNMDRLQQAINAAAIWQTASVIVAQKHLADIHEKLEAIQRALMGVSRWLDNQRKARLGSIHDYLLQGALAIQAGELSPALRQEFEACERDAAEIFGHLAREFEQEVTNKVVHSEWFGTGDLALNLKAKLGKLEEIAGDMRRASEIRVGAWHLVRLYPGETKLVEARRESIRRATEKFLALGAKMSNELGDEISAMKAWTNRAVTLNARKSELHAEREKIFSTTTCDFESIQAALRKADDRFIELDRPTRLLVELRDGEVVGVRQLLA